MQHVVPVPHAGHGQVVHAVDVKKSAHTPCAQTWFDAHGVPQLPGWFEQWIGLRSSCVVV